MSPKTKTKKKPRGRPRTERLTVAQRRVYRCIEQAIRRHGKSPTMQELADALGIAPPSAYGHVQQLLLKGVLEREPNKTRGLRLGRHPDDDDVARLVSIPLFGMVAAGKPILAEENVLGEVLIEGYLLERGPCFALRVRGDSMVDAGIGSNDVVIVRQQPLAESGEIVVALVDGDATLKRLFIADHRIELRPENEKHRPIPIGPETDLRIVGKVIAVRHVAKAGCAASP